MKRVTALGATLALLLAPALVRLLKAQSPPQGSAASFAVSPPALAYVGSVFNFSVTAFDQSSNAAKSYTGTVHFTSTDPQAVLPPDYTFTTGDSSTHMFSATLNTPGTQTITATDTANGAISGMSNSITVSPTPPPPAPTFTLTDLGPLQITAFPSGATAFNASGQVTGFRFENFPSPVCFAGGADRVFLWSNGVYTELGTLGGYSSFGYGINNAGQIVGSSDICPNGIETGQRAFIWQNGTMTALDQSTNPNDSSVAFAINTNGDVAGYTNHVGNSANPEAVIWKGGTAAGLTVLQSLACQFTACQTRALAINDSGQAAGWGMGPFVHGLAGSYNANQAVMWDANGQPIGLGSLGNFWNDQANAINSKGDVAGYSQLDPGTYYSIARAAFWQNGNPQNPQDLGTIPGFDPIFGSGSNITDNSSSAWGINSNREIVGISAYGSGGVLQATGGGRAFLYVPRPASGTGGQMYDLLSLLAPGTNWRQLQAAWAINDNGQILGVGIDPNQQEHGFLLTPIITPTTTALSTSGTPSVFGQSVSFTATVTPAPPNSNAVNDTVTFFDGNMSIGPGNYNGNGVWILNTPLSVGNRSITASYSGDYNYGASTSAALTQTVNQAATTTALVSVSPNPANFGQTVTLTAQVTVVAPGLATRTGPSGPVTFFDNGAALTCSAGNQSLSGGQATCQCAFTTPGLHSLTASYAGDTDFTGSTTAAVTITVNQPVLSITKTHTGSFAQGQTGALYTLTVSNAAGSGPTSGIVAVTDTPPSGLTLVTLAGTGWSCTANTCTRSDVLTGGTSYPPITATVNVVTNAASPQVNVGNVSGGGSASASASDSTTITPNAPLITSPVSGFSTTNPNVVVSGTGASGASVSILDGTATVGTSPVDSAGNFSVAITLAVGTHSLTATQILNGVTSAASARVTVIIQLPPAVITDNETITVTDAESFPDVFDPEKITVTDQVSIQVLNTTTTSIAITGGGVYGTPASAVVSVSSPAGMGNGNVTLAVDGGAPSTMALTSHFDPLQEVAVGSATFNLGVLQTANHALVANFAAQGSFAGSSAQAILTVSPATPTITWPTPLYIVNPTPLSSVQLNATASVPGSFVYSPPSGTILNVGTQTLAVTFTPTDTTNYTTASASVPLLVVSKQTTITLVSCGIGTPVNVGSTTFCDAFVSTFDGIMPGGGVTWTATGPISNPGTFLFPGFGGSPTTLCVFPFQSVGKTGTGDSCGLNYQPAPLSNGITTITATYHGDPNHSPSSGTVSLQVLGVPAITWSPAGIIFGTPLGSAQLNATASVPGTFVYNPPAGSIVSLYPNYTNPLAPPPNTLQATFTPADSAHYGTVTTSVLLNITPAMPTITWANPAPIDYGTPLDSTQLNATASVPILITTYSPPAGTVLSPGSHTLSVQVSPFDFFDYTSPNASVTLVVNNTPTGNMVSVSPKDSTTGASPVSLTFTNVSTAGLTSLMTSSNGPTTPSGFAVGSPSTFFDLSTTAVFTPPINVCINYSAVTFLAGPPALFHYENGAWVNRTTSVDRTNMIVCGSVTSLSPFALFAPLPVLTITPTSVPRQYGQPNPSLNNLTYSGFVNGDGPGSLSGNLICTTTATQASPVGSYPITCSGLTSANYTITFMPGTLTVTPAPLTVTANNQSKTYGQTVAFAGTEFTAGGLLNADKVTSVTLASAGAAATASVTGSPYPITPSAALGTGLGNYNISYVNGTLAVTPALLTITADNKTKILNAPLPSFTATYSGFANGDSAASLTGALGFTANATASSPVGTYTITPSGQSSSNYAIGYKAGTLTIIYQPGGMCDGDFNHQILQPINADGTSVWKQGRTIPAKFRVCDANGLSIGTPGVVASFNLVQIIAGTITTVDETVSSTTADTAFRWDPTGQQWIFNISTANLSANQTYVYTITLNDGSTIAFQYGLR